MEQEVRGITSIKTSQKSKIRSMPRAKGAEHLELFLLEKNKTRLEKEKTNVDKRITQIAEDLKSIDEEVSELKGLVANEKGKEGDAQKFKKLVPKKPIKVMKFEY